MQTLVRPVPLPAQSTGNDLSGLRRKAEELETLFLSEMLAHAGLDGSPTEFGGGIGEEQFGSFLREAQASAIAKAGGIGLAETLFRAMSREQDV